ncbi:uncharacterized protein [Dermacentor albipictus]|uniref:uncharacterized protein isoform X1 n=1 Tax=Dermacentor albipictus TaxID=60249 RepID=UPI0031FC20D9
MSTYSPFMAAPLDVLAQRLEVLECVGYHCVYKYGRVNSMEMTSDFDPPFTSGITFRVFFYRPDDKILAQKPLKDPENLFLIAGRLFSFPNQIISFLDVPYHEAESHSACRGCCRPMDISKCSHVGGVDEGAASKSKYRRRKNC